MNINNLAERPLLHSPHEPDSQPRYEDRGWMDYSVLNNTWKEKYQEQGREENSNLSAGEKSMTPELLGYLAAGNTFTSEQK